ncbi:MAG: hypothetical protein JXR95_09940 [Deltaproteobacteria bacterium]|nr:hypothetical protein [Deltaproteobacteria bacterium]
MKYSIFLIVAPMAMAFLVPFLGHVMPALSKGLSFLTALAGTVLSVFLLITYKTPFTVIMGGWIPPFGINLHVDMLSLLFATVVYGAVTLGIAFQLSSVVVKKPYFYMLILLLLTSLNGMILTGDLFNLFVFMEIAGISSWALIASGNKTAGVRGALQYMVVASLASVAYLAAIAIIYSSTGTLNMAQISGGLREMNSAMAALAVLLILASLFTEMEIFPFNSWVGSAYRGAPSSISGLLSSAVALAGAYAMLRISYIVFGAGMGNIIRFGSFNITSILFWMGVVTVVTGEASAFTQKDAKRMLAWSSVGQMGMILMAIAIASEKSIYGAVFALITHSISKLLLFMIVGRLVSATGTSDWTRWKGIGRKNSILGIFFIIGALGVTGIPLFAGFWGKFTIIGSAFKSTGSSYLGVYIILAATVMEAVYFLRLAHALFEEPERKPGKVNTGIVFWTCTTLLALAVVIIGVFPAPLDRKIKKIPSELRGDNTSGYISTVYKAMGR